MAVAFLASPLFAQPLPAKAGLIERFNNIINGKVVPLQANGKSNTTSVTGNTQKGDSVTENNNFVGKGASQVTTTLANGTTITTSSGNVQTNNNPAGDAINTDFGDLGDVGDIGVTGDAGDPFAGGDDF